MSRHCRVCGAPLPARVLAGHCPHCLVQVSLDGVSSVDTAPNSQEQLPRAFGEYELLSEVARGGMGVVYRARQRSLGRQVALKMILSGPFASRAALERFRAEARVAAGLQHSGIVAIHEVGETEGQPYFTMDFIEGRNLADLVRNGPLPSERAARYVEQIARAVDYAHQHGVLHRDLKPANVLIDQTDQPRITDFGLAKQLSPSQFSSHNPQLTLTGQTLGSPHYMAPEQAASQNGEVGVAADIYSLGALLYHLVTGRPPFAAGTLGETLHQVIHNEPPRPRVLDPSLPRDLETICLKCLEKDPVRRYPAAATVAEELARFRRGAPVLARPIGQGERLWRWGRRNRAVATLGAFAALLPLAVMLALALLMASNLRIRQERNQKDLALRERAVALDSARKGEQRAWDELFRALCNEARARRFSRQMGQRLDSLKALADAARIHRDENLRDEAIATLALADVELRASWTNERPSEMLALVFDQLYQRYARLNKDGSISVHKVPEGSEIQKLEPTGGELVWKSDSGLSFSPDGRFVAELDYTSSVRLWRLGDGQSVLHNPPERPLALAFSPDNRWLVVAAPGAFTRFEIRTGEAVNRWPAPGLTFSMAFNPDNRRLAVGDADSDTVSVYDAMTGAELAVLKTGPSEREIVAWHPDGRRLAVAGSDPRIQIWDTDTATRVATLEGHAQQVVDLSFHPAGGLLASGSWDGMMRLWDPNAARQVLEIPFGPQAMFSEDGRWLGFRPLSGQIELWAVTPNEEHYSLGQGFAYEGDVSPDGRFLAMGMYDGLRVWDLLRRRQVSFRPLEGTFSVFFASGGRELITCGPKEGLQRWPVQMPESGAVGDFGIGTPRPIPLSWPPQYAAGSHLGRAIGVISEATGEGLILDLTSNAPSPGLQHPRGNCLDVSPDGRWAATAGWHSTLVRLWDAGSGKLVHEWPLGGQNKVAFTPDSRELIISSPGEFSFWNLATLKPRLRLPSYGFYPGHVAFSPDQKLMALEMTPGIIHLKEAATGRTIAKLEDPFRDRSTWMAFIGDGTQLIAAARYAKTIHIWDLARIRTDLKALGLDWDWPDFPVAVQPRGSLPTSLNSSSSSSSSFSSSSSIR